MKKILALVVAFALCFTAVAGCITTSAEDAAAPAIEISSVTLENTAGATSFTVRGTNCSTIAAQKLTVTIEAGVTFDGIEGLINAANVATGEDADYYVETVDGNTVVTLVSVLNIGDANDTFTYTFNVTVPANETEEAVVYDVTAATVAGSIDEEYINVEIAPATITVNAPVVEPEEPSIDTDLVFRDAYATITESLGAEIRIRRSAVSFEKYSKIEVIIIPTGYSDYYNEQQEAAVVNEIIVENKATGHYYANYNNIGMYELDLPFTAQMKAYDKDGNYVAYSAVETYKPSDLLKEQYDAAAAAGSSAEKLNILVTDMLNMGAAAQTYFASRPTAAGSHLKATVDAGNVMNKEWTGVGSTTVPELRHDGETTYTGVDADRNELETAVDLSGAPVVAYTVRDRDLVYTDKALLSMTVSYTKYYDEADGGRVVSDTIEGDEWAAFSNSTGKRFDYLFNSCAMYDANKEITLVITYDGNEVVRSTYSLEQCIYDTLAGSTNETLNNALNGIATFAASARAYFATRGTVDPA